jgi:phosphoesterase RecJ-like protein
MMTTEAAIDSLLETFRSTPRFILTSHASPDGDAIGSVLALAATLSQIGCKTDIVLADPVPHSYLNLPGVERIRITRTVTEPHTPAILLECDSIERTGLQGLEGRSLINIDHHASGKSFASINWIDENACAVAALVYRIAKAAEVRVTTQIATCLYAAILSDTGSFNYSSTNAETFAIAHDLTTCGANPGQIARDLFFSNPESKVRLLGTALSNMQCDGQVAWSWVTHRDMDHAGAAAEDCEGVVNYLIGISGVESAVFLRELPDESLFRLSIRSKGKIDVAQIAEIFGGGGHRSASGCTLEGPLETATARILAQLRMGLC